MKKLSILFLLLAAHAQAYTTTPNMSLQVPSIGDTDYPTSIRNSFTLIDTHDHTAGNGVLIGSGALASSSVTAAKISTSVAGNGLTGGAGTALAVNVDGSTIEINSDTLRVKDAGVVTAKIADSNVTTAKIADANVTTAKIANSNVTGVKIETNTNLPGNAVQENGKNVLVSSANSATGTSLKVVRAAFDASATLQIGEGATAVHNSTGTYTVTFGTAFADIPAVSITAVSAAGGAYFPTIVSTTTTTIVLHTWSSGVGAVDADFHVIAIGSR